MGQLASAWTEGLQNSSSDPNHLQVAVTLKHFVAVREPFPDPARVSCRTSLILSHVMSSAEFCRVNDRVVGDGGRRLVDSAQH